ncbi:mannose-6-phosphate isomerase, class I [Paenalkalicoccus suaedae]|uniref:Mannose-6-phosphate isomerase n=1 Tax=Paenalkalicoccus suaedae TaxID=2592382 RepID=A0A859FIX4_9BACI|nr:mannose-6-phosphate isomerase, class I [Paenalkalicoccus suaedae]QKS72296.1 mannose-6-phosphate isomerase, class I [Paenalkalicoccus suaedae]
MNDILLLDPIFKEKVWGGAALKEQFGYDIPSEKTGESWGISGHKHGSNVVSNGMHKGKTIRELWEQAPALFNRKNESEFPLLVKMIDARDDLSVQVHPDDAYATEHEGYAFGKTECWYILAAEPGAELILGHHATTREELATMVEAGEWDKLLRRIPVQAGDFVYVPSGTVHAIGKGIVLLEVQQSSDITYRFYDYDRPDDDGNMRELHVEDSIACTMVPHEDLTPERQTTTDGDATVTTLIEAEYFTVTRYELDGEMMLGDSDMHLLTVLDGNPTAYAAEVTYKLPAGRNAILPAGVQVKLEGKATFIVARAK